MLTKHGGKNNCKKQTLFYDWASWLTSKDFLKNCGQDDGPYPSWEPFMVIEIKMLVGLFVLNRISMSPRLEWKFQTQDEDPVNGSNLCHATFRNNSARGLE